MPVDLNEPGPRNPEDPQLQTMFRDLQGNILEGHGRGHTVNVFIRFGGSVADVRNGPSALGIRSRGCGRRLAV